MRNLHGQKTPETPRGLSLSLLRRRTTWNGCGGRRQGGEEQPKNVSEPPRVRRQRAANRPIKGATWWLKERDQNMRGISASSIEWGRYLSTVVPGGWWAQGEWWKQHGFCHADAGEGSVVVYKLLGELRIGSWTATAALAPTRARGRWIGLALNELISSSHLFKENSTETGREDENESCRGNHETFKHYNNLTWA